MKVKTNQNRFITHTKGFHGQKPAIYIQDQLSKLLIDVSNIFIPHDGCFHSETKGTSSIYTPCSKNSSNQFTHLCKDSQAYHST